MHCRSGGRSAAASKIIVEMGFKVVYDLADGMMGWEDEGKPGSGDGSSWNSGLRQRRNN